MSRNKNLSKLLNSCLSGHLLWPCFLFSSFPFSQLCLICSRGLSQCQLCYSSVPPGCQCFNSLQWCWMLTPRVSRKSRQDITVGGTRFALLDPPPSLHCFIWGSVYPKWVLLYPSQGRPTVSHPAAFKRPPPALNQTTCEINITLTHVSNSWCQSQTERMKRKKKERSFSRPLRWCGRVSVRVSYSSMKFESFGIFWFQLESFDFNLILHTAGAKMIMT